MFGDSFDCVMSVWRESLAGGATIVVSVGVGWRIGRGRRSLPVRVVRWWLAHVVDRVTSSRTWLGAAALIALNNSLICAAVVAAGSLGYVVWAAVGGVGLALGIALRRMISVAIPEQHEGRAPGSRGRVRQAVGMTLNLLEVPAILLSAGLGLAQGALSSAVDPATAMRAFGLIVVPLLAIGAVGEGLWMTVGPKLPRFSLPR